MIDTNIPFRAIESPYANPLMQTIRDVGEGVQAPTAYDISEIYLPETYNEMKEFIKTLEPVWDERGVSIMCDGWTGPTNMHIINFLVYSVRGTIFHKSVDASHVLRKDANYYFKLMKDVVKEIDPHRVIQMVTDNEAAVKAEDLGKRKNIKAVIEQAQKVTRFIYHYKWAANYMKTFTAHRELLHPSLTRFATNFIMLESVVDLKIALQNMFNSPGWINTRYYNIDETEVEVRELFSRSPSTEVVKFWDKADEIIKIQAPIVRVLRLVDGDPLPTMGYIFEAMERCKLAIRENCTSYKQYWAMIDKRWDSKLHQDLHAAGCYFNPKFLYGVDKFSTDKEIKKSVKNVIEKLVPDIDTQIRASTQLFMYEQKMDSFASTVAQRAINLMDPATWWLTYGESAPALQAIAVRVLSQTTSSSNYERNWSMWSLVHTKTRNRLKYKKLHQIVYLRYNMWLQRKHQTRRSEKEIATSFDPINLDNIFDCSTPINNWLEVEPFKEAEGTSWIYASDDENDAGFRETGEEGNRVIRPEFAYHNRVQTIRDSVLTPPSSDDDGNRDDDGGGQDDGGGGRGEYMNSYSGEDAYVPPENYDDPPPSFTMLDQVYECAHKGKNVANDMDINKYSWQGLSGNAVANESVGSNIDPYFPYYPNCESAGYPPSSGYDSISNS
ncbi:uncharacterized protein LOC141649523 [Silene latifolia]|uniref:uncharacterized protein LOC141649523 n=1 Tax=Silene latifolia TaxID=37657 RepID=UPI003D78786D